VKARPRASLDSRDRLVPGAGLNTANGREVHHRAFWMERQVVFLGT